jgi:uncharacterized protein
MLIDYARTKTSDADIQLIPTVTTNGTISDFRAWALMTLPEMELAISVDGRPENHDRYRRFANGKGSSDVVLTTLDKLIKKGKAFKVVCVVGPENVKIVDENIHFLRSLGVRQIEPSLDLWSQWDSSSLENLEQTIIRCAKIWLEGLPDFNLSWYDDKAALLAQFPNVDRCRCGFGKGDIAVTPAGNLYPCERLIGDDAEENHARLPGHVGIGDDFLFGTATNTRTAEPCRECGIEAVCNTTCGCCNQIRTGKPGQPDGLLCMFNQWCLRETQAILEKIVVPSKTGNKA